MTCIRIYTALLLFAAAFGFAQQPRVQAGLDSAKIKIGSQANLTVKAFVDANARVNFPEGKNFGQLEVLESYPVDTVKDGSRYTLIKKYGLTQFDSGRYVIPRLPIVINNRPLQTNELRLEVADVKVDTLKQKMYDIKPVLAARSVSTWWIWLLCILGLAGAGYALWRYLKNRKRNPKAAPEVFVAPLDKASWQLQKLENRKLLERGEVKEYYSELANIARVYIEETVHIPAMESTTGELIEAMRATASRQKMVLDNATFEDLEKVLRNADMVKFAKSRPEDFEIAQDRTRVQKAISVIDKSIPKQIEDDYKAKELEEALRRKKEKQRKTYIIAGSVAAGVILLLGIGYFSAKDYLQANFFGYPSKELLEGEWVKSEYGYPGVTIETPKVLKREDPTKFIPKAAMGHIKDMSMFIHGTLFGNLYIMVNTISYKQPVDADLDAGVDVIMKTWEAQGAKNIVLKSESFSTPQGIDGLHAYGTMTLPDPLTKEPSRASYDVYLFKQQNGLQQVVLLRKDSDDYARQIMERVKNSIELRNLNR